MASVEARALLRRSGLFGAFCETGECNDGSEMPLVSMSFKVRWPLVVRGVTVSLTLGSFRDSAAAGEVTPRLVELASRALPLPLFLPYCHTASANERRDMRMQEGRMRASFIRTKRERIIAVEEEEL